MAISARVWTAGKVLLLVGALATTFVVFAIAAAPPLLAAVYRRLINRSRMRRLEPVWRDLTGDVPDSVFSAASTGVDMPRRRRFGLSTR